MNIFKAFRCVHVHVHENKISKVSRMYTRFKVAAKDALRNRSINYCRRYLAIHFFFFSSLISLSLTLSVRSIGQWWWWCTVFQQMRYLFGCLLQRRRDRPFIIILKWLRIVVVAIINVSYTLPSITTAVAASMDVSELLGNVKLLGIDSVVVCGGQQISNKCQFCTWRKVHASNTKPINTNKHMTNIRKQMTSCQT